MTSIKLSMPKPTREILPASAPEMTRYQPLNTIPCDREVFDIPASSSRSLPDSAPPFPLPKHIKNGSVTLSPIWCLNLKVEKSWNRCGIHENG